MPGTFKDLVSPDGSRVSRRVFASEEVYRGEVEQIFRRNWFYLAHESQLRKLGDFVTAYIGETPLIVARAASGNVVASVNSCSHRGLPVCRVDLGHAERFVCPYHNWTYSVEGDLIAIPHERNVAQVDRSKMGLKRIPRVDSAFGMIFGSLNPDIEPLDDYIGDMKFYLEPFFNLFPGGWEVVGTPHRWQVAGNWKLPYENQLGDMGHAAHLHATSTYDTPGMRDVLDNGKVAVPRAGHAAALRLLPQGSDPALFAWGVDALPGVPAHVLEYLVEAQRTAKERMSEVQSRLKPLVYGLYPNLSLLLTSGTLRVSHPRGPGRIEYWSWWIVPKEAPDELKELLRGNYNIGFGPGGMLEQEDSLAWTQQHIGSSISYLDDVPYNYAMGLGEEGPHPELPGKIGRVYNDFFAREFFTRWRADMLEEACR